MAKITTVIILLFLLATSLFSQQRPPFSEIKVEIDGRVFLPYTKGEIVRKINGPQKPVLDRICSIITTWDSIAPPQGIKVFCSGFDNSIEIFFQPYLFEDGARFASEGGPTISIYMNNPLQMFGSPIAPDIFLCPQKTASFYGYPIYQNDHQEVTIVSKKSVQLFIPVSQEEYLKALITKEEKSTFKTSGSDYQTTYQEMEKVYQKLLRTDKEAARELKEQIDEFRKESATINDSSKIPDLVSVLKKELSDLTDVERGQQAFYGGPWAMEEFHNVSGLIPYENRKNGDALVKANPKLMDKPSIGGAQLLVISWSIGENHQNADKPRFYNEGRKGFYLADILMSELYKNQTIWNKIFSICN